MDSDDDRDGRDARAASRELRHAIRNEIQAAMPQIVRDIVPGIIRDTMPGIVQKTLREELPQMWGMNPQDWWQFQTRVRDTVEAHTRNQERAGIVLNGAIGKAVEYLGALALGGIGAYILAHLKGGLP